MRISRIFSATSGMMPKRCGRKEHAVVAPVIGWGHPAKSPLFEQLSCLVGHSHTQPYRVHEQCLRGPAAEERGQDGDCQEKTSRYQRPRVMGGPAKPSNWRDIPLIVLRPVHDRVENARRRVCQRLERPEGREGRWVGTTFRLWRQTMRKGEVVVSSNQQPPVRRWRRSSRQ